MSSRTIAFIPAEGRVEGRGYRVSFVFENKPGHYPTGDWPYDGSPGQRMPWFWGNDYESAVEIADKYNESRGISRSEALDIVTSSIQASQYEKGRELRTFTGVRKAPLKKDLKRST